MIRTQQLYSTLDFQNGELHLKNVFTLTLYFQAYCGVLFSYVSYALFMQSITYDSLGSCKSSVKTAQYCMSPLTRPFVCGVMQFLVLLFKFGRSFLQPWQATVWSLWTLPEISTAVMHKIHNVQNIIQVVHYPVLIAGSLFSLQGFPCKPLYFPVRDCSVLE